MAIFIRNIGDLPVVLEKEIFGIQAYQSTRLEDPAKNALSFFISSVKIMYDDNDLSGKLV